MKAKGKFNGPMSPVNVPAQVAKGMSKAKVSAPANDRPCPAPKSADLPKPLRK